MRLAHVVIISLMLFVVALCFWPVLNADFVDWDDGALIVANQNYRGLSWRNIEWMFTTCHLGPYQPLSWMTLAVDYIFWKMDPFGYHLTNLLLHLANTVVMYFLIMTVLLLVFADSKPDISRLRLAALFGALMFAVHPLRVESVAWVSERRDVLCGFFLLLTVMAYFKIHASAAGRRRWYCMALFFFTLSLLAKAWGMTLPLVLLALDIYPLRRLSSFRDCKSLLVEKIPYLILAAGTMVIAYQGVSSMADSVEHYSMSQRIVQASYGIWFYLWKTIAPTGLSPLYFLDREELATPGFLVCIPGAISMVAALFLLRNKYPGLVCACFCYAVIVSPVLGMIKVGMQLVADRYSYISCMPFAILAGGIIYATACKQRSRPVAIIALISLCTAAVATLGYLTNRQTLVWQNTKNLWQQTTKVAPDSKMWVLVANVYLQERQPAKALEIYERLEREVGSEKLALVLVECHVDMGNYQKARHYLDLLVKTEKENSSRLVLVYYWYARIHIRHGEFARAEECFQKVLAMKNPQVKVQQLNGNIIFHPLQDSLQLPQEIHETVDPQSGLVHAVTWFYLADMYRLQGRLDLAEKALEQGLSCYPQFVGIHISLGLLCEQIGDHERAQCHFQDALVLYEEDIYRSFYSIGGMIDVIKCGIKAGRPDVVLPYGARLVAEYPQNGVLYVYLGNLYLLKCDFEQAIVNFERAIALAPDLVEPYQNLIQIHHLLHQPEQAEKYRRLLLEKSEKRK